MRLLQEQSLGLMIDVQEKLFPHMAEKENLLKMTQVLLQGLQMLGVPVVVTQQYTKGLGATIPELAGILGSFTFHEKRSFSCCDAPDIFKTLQQYERPTIIVFGIETHVCILQTTIDLIRTGFAPVVVADCTSSRKPYDRETALQRMVSEGAIITTTESLLFELTRTSESEVFRKISALVK
ncbi:MAG: hydrolase [Bacteroidales bacterium]